MKHLIKLSILPILLLSSCVNTPSEPPQTELINDAFKIDFKNAQINKNEDGDYILDFYGISDFHGAVEEDETDPGIAKIGSMYSNFRLDNPGGAFFFSSGDMWQGSADSNITKGSLVTKLMNHIGFEAMTLGNHEFDWKIETIIENKQIAEFPFLASNIVYKETSSPWDITSPYTLIDRGELQVGVIGSIGEGITKSIIASNVIDLEFIDPFESVRNSSIELKELGADIIIYLTHDDMNSITPQIAQYIDVAFCGHTHLEQNTLVNGVPVLQSSNNGNKISHVELSYDGENIEIIKKENIKVDKTILPHKDINDLYLDIYAKDIKEIKEEVVGNINRDISTYEIISVLLKNLYLEFNKNEDILFVTHNEARSGFKKGDITYGDIYKALPFDNYLVIAEIEGKNLHRYISGMTYPDSFDIVFENNKTYKIVTIDYLTEKYGQTINEVKIDLFSRDFMKNLFLNDSDNNPFN